MKKIIIISYYYPPLSNVGSLRALGFSKYLSLYGWKPYILTVKNPDKALCTIGDEKPPKEIEIFYSRSLFNLTRFTGKLNALLCKILNFLGLDLKSNFFHDVFCIPDIFLGWIPNTFIKGLNIIRKNNINAIYVSSKPFSSAIVGILLKKITNQPLILDFRDPVSFPKNSFSALNLKFRMKIIKKIEEYTLKDADTFIVTTEETKEWYMRMYPFLKNKIYTIYNGYFIENLPKSNNAFNKFTIIYVGNFYHNYKNISSEVFFLALQKAIKEQKVPKEKIQFLYLGAIRKKDNWLDIIGKKYNLQNIIVNPGRVTREESINTISKSSMLLLRFIPPMISTKLFEGLAIGIPLLAIINEGEVTDLIRRYSKNSYIITSNYVDNIVNAIKDAYDKWNKGELKKKINEEFLQNFNKKSLTKQFVQVLEKTCQ